MKKYVKPDLKYENFMLSHNIASCSSDIFDINKNGRLEEYATSQDGLNCTFDIDGITLFTGENVNCIFDFEDTGYEDYCYQTNNAGSTLFRS